MKKQKSIKSLFMSQRIIALSCLVFLFLFFSCFGKNFLTKNSMVSLLESVYYIICLAFGMTFVISTGGIDLSIGSVAMCGALIGGVSYNEWHMPIWAALIITVLVTTVFGVLNGFLVSCCKIPPFVATMGTQYLAQGIGYIVSRVQTMRYPVVTSPDGWFKRVFYKSLNGFPMGVIYMVILFVIASFIFRYTKIGKYACPVNMILSTLLKEGKVDWDHGSEQMLDFIYIEDCVEAIAKISLADHNPHAEYNIGGGEVIPYTRIIDKARKLFPTAPIHVGPGDLGYDNLGALSVQRAFEDFGWKPRFSIEQGMEQYMNWLKNF